MATRFRLPNGLTVVHEESRAAAVVAFQLWVGVGSADEDAHEVGLAHLHEHMLFKGTKRRGPGEIARTVEAHGGEINAWTSFDQTVYHVVMASRFAREGLDVLADAVRSSAFDAEELSREQEVVCEEIKRSTDMPSRRASKALFAAAFEPHPYARPVIGFETNVRSHTRARVVSFYERHYTPANIVLAASGDCSEAQLKSWANELLGGDWGRVAVAKRPRTTPRPWQGIRVDTVEDDVKEAWVHLAFQGVPAHHPQAPTLDVLAMVAGQGDASRLSLEVKRKRALVKEVSAWSWTPAEQGLFAASIVARPDLSAEAFEASALVLATLTTTEIDSDELETVKGLIEADTIYQRETVQGVARKLGSYETTMGGFEKEAEYTQAIAKVTPETLREAAQQYLTFDTAVVTGLMPKGTVFGSDEVATILKRVSANRPRSLAKRNTAPSQTVRPRTISSRPKPVVTIERLPSGATLIVKEERTVPLFSMRASALGGLRYETASDNGISALWARTLTRGTHHHESEQISHLIDDLGGSLSAIGGRSSMSVRSEFLSKHFERAFDLFAEVLTEPAFPSTEVHRERQSQLLDIAARDDRPASVAFELFARTLFTQHPYRFSLSGETGSVQALTSENLAQWHRRLWHPSRLFLAVVGDVDTQAVLERATSAFGTARSPLTQEPHIEPEPPIAEPRVVRRFLEKAQTHLVLGFLGARVTDRWRRPLEVMSTLLSGQSGRLFLELRDKRSLAYSVSASTLEGVDPGYFAVFMATSPEKVPQALAGMRHELSVLHSIRVSEDELLRAKRYLIGSQQIGLQRNGARASTMALDACYGLGAEHHTRYAEEIESVTADEILEVSRRIIDFDREVVVSVGRGEPS